METEIQTEYDTNELMKIIPHRYPFLLVDKILNIDIKKGTIVGQKNVTINESFFQGHFPGAPIMPGVLILEALAQTGGVLVYLQAEKDTPKIAVLLNIKNAKFRNRVKPGDVLKLHCEGLHFSSTGGRIQAKAYVEDKIAAEAEMSFVFVNKDQI